MDWNAYLKFTSHTTFLRTPPFQSLQVIAFLFSRIESLKVTRLLVGSASTVEGFGPSPFLKRRFTWAWRKMGRRWENVRKGKQDDDCMGRISQSDPTRSLPVEHRKRRGNGLEGFFGKGMKEFLNRISFLFAIPLREINEDGGERCPISSHMRQIQLHHIVYAHYGTRQNENGLPLEGDVPWGGEEEWPHGRKPILPCNSTSKAG